jgi:hypothetical protein
MAQVSGISSLIAEKTMLYLMTACQAQFQPIGS